MICSTFFSAGGNQQGRENEVKSFNLPIFQLRFSLELVLVSSLRGFLSFETLITKRLIFLRFIVSFDDGAFSPPQLVTMISSLKLSVVIRYNLKLFISAHAIKNVRLISI